MKLSCSNLRYSHHGNINKQLGKGLIPSYKIHMMEEGTLDGGPKGGGKEEMGEGG